MVRDLARLGSQPFDLLVVGGGVYGLAAAYDAARRGFSVALVEQDDFGGATSFNHLKTIHGGLRYLQHGDLGRVRQSIHERRTLAEIAPHLLLPLPFMMATRGITTRSRAALRVAFAADALLGRARNAGVPPALALPSGRVLPRAACPARFLEMTSTRVSGAALWYDYQTRNSDRLTLAFGLGAARHGAALANYVEAVEAVREGARILGMIVQDRLSDRRFPIRARVTLNAAGAGASRIMAALGTPSAVPLIKAMNLVTSRPADGPAIASPTRDGRLLFLVPWRGRALIGTSHADHLVDPGPPVVTEAELTGFIREANEAFPALRLDRGEVRLVHRGLVAATRDRHGRLGLEGHTILRDHAADGVEGALSVVGVKYTTARGVAQRVIDLVARKLGREAPSTTGEALLPGATTDLDRVAAALGVADPEVPADVAQHLAETYGTDAGRVLRAGTGPAGRPTRLAPGTPILAAEVSYAVREEMACRLADVVVRRTPLGALGYPGEDVVRSAGAIMAAELGWSAARLDEEVAAVVAFYAPISV